MAIITQSLSYKLNSLRQEWVGVAQDLFQRDMMKGIVDGLTTVSSGIETVVDKLGLLGTAAAGVGIVALVKNLKSVRTEVQNVNAALSAMNNISALSGMTGSLGGVKAPENLFKTETVQAYQKALKNLSNTEAELALQERDFTDAETQAMMIAMGRTATTDEITEAYARQILTLGGLKKEEQDNIISTVAFTTAEEGEAAGLEITSKAVLEDAINHSTLTAEQKAAAIAALEEAAATKTDTAAHTGLIKALRKEIAQMGAWIAANAAMTASIAAIAAAVIAFVASVEYMGHAYQRAEEAQQEAVEKYEAEKETLDSLQSEYQETKDRIEELTELKVNGEITLAEESELELLQAQSAELENQIAIVQQLSDTMKTGAADATEALMNTEESYLQHLEKSSNKFVAFFKWLWGFGFTDEGLEWSEADTSVTGQLETDIENLKKDQEELADVTNQLYAEPDNKKLIKRQKELGEEIQEITSDISDEQATIESWIDTMTDDNGKPLEGYENAVNDLKKSLDNLAKMNLSDLDRELYDITSFFDGTAKTNFISDALIKAREDGEDLTYTLASIGLSLDDIGSDVSIETLTRYFDELVDSANAADEAIRAVDGSVEGVTSAFETENQNAEWETMADYLAQAAELYDNYLTGTDDFRAAVQFITPETLIPTKPEGAEADWTLDSDFWEAAWLDAVDKVNRYFDKENPIQSVINLTDDLIDSGLAEYIGDPSEGLTHWTDEFKTSADAAEAWGISIDAAEVALHDLEAYGYEFDDIFFVGEGLDEYESALNSVKSIYDSLGEGATKDRLGKQIENWDKDLEGFEDDLSKLTEEQIVHLEFEYNLASLESQIDQVKQLIESGAVSTENYAALITANESYIDYAKEGLNFDISLNTDQAIAELQGQLRKATSEEERLRLQAEIVNQQEMEKGLLNAFTDAHPEITVDSDVEEVEAAWEEFTSKPQTIYVDSELNDDDVNQLFEELEDHSRIVFTADIDNVENTVTASLDKDGEIIYAADIDGVRTQVYPIESEPGVITYTADVTEAEAKLAELEQNTATFNADVDGVMRTITSVKDEEGNITYTANISGVETDVGAIIDEEGNITYTADMDAVNEAMEEVEEETINVNLTVEGGEEATQQVEELTEAIEEIPDDHNTKVTEEGAEDVTSAANDTENALEAIHETVETTISQTGASSVISAARDVKSALDAIDRNVTTTIKENTIKTTTVLGQEAQGTAHKDGTAKAQGTAKSSGSWRIGSAQNALVGELGPEIVVRDGRYFTVGDNGAEVVPLQANDIVFNHKQTAAILSNGYVNERGSYWGDMAQATGSAFANAGRKPSTSTARSSSSSSSSSTASTASSVASSASSVASSTESAAESAEEFSETLDWIEIKLDRIEREIDSLDLKVSSTYKTWSTRNTALSDEISKVTEEIDLQTQAYNRYLQEANSLGLSESYAKLVREGKIDISTITDEDLYDLIEQYQDLYEKALDCQQQVEELEESISDLYKTAFDNIQTEYEGYLGVIEYYMDYINEQISQVEARGYLVSTKYYDTLIEQENENIKQLEKEREALSSSLSDAVNSGAIKEGSEAWYEMCSAINEVTLAIEQANTALLEYNNTIRELNWEVFDLVEDRISKITDEVDFLIDLMSSSNLYEDNGQLTDTGMATMGLYGVNYNTYMAQAEKYAEELADIEKEIASDPYNQDLIDRRDELLELQRESILAAQDEKEAIRDMVENGIELELSALSELIDSYTEALDSAKD